MIYYKEKTKPHYVRADKVTNVEKLPQLILDYLNITPEHKNLTKYLITNIKVKERDKVNSLFAFEYDRMQMPTNGIKIRAIAVKLDSMEDTTTDTEIVSEYLRTKEGY